ncbi:60S ribosomal protein L26 [Microtus ochrogaster]|uniref:60S ribosomal protein L26 n=1 Tax=Microtus ochrogaster TaxID=79684 RepID=A0A8J6GED4_MICOH|nr:60S ribosomal protein L26 [Microtus ochrogaster]
MMTLRLCEDTTETAEWRGRLVTCTEKVQKEKANGTAVHMGVHPSRVVITRLMLDKAAEKILEGQAWSRPVGRKEGKHKRGTTEKMQGEKNLMHNVH